MTQEVLASKAGINEKYYGRIERGESCPTINSVVKLCDAMEIDIVELLLMEVGKNERQFRRNPNVIKAIINGLRSDIDIHFNRDVIFDGCESSIWYNGFVGSMNFDEFELRIYAEGNIRGHLFRDYEEILELNSGDISNELKKYISDDSELQGLIEYMPFDYEVLEEKGGNAFFISESNWLIAHLINNYTEEIIRDDIILESDNIMDVLKNEDIIFDCIYSENNINQGEKKNPHRIGEYARRVTG